MNINKTKTTYTRLGFEAKTDSEIWIMLKTLELYNDL